MAGTWKPIDTEPMIPFLDDACENIEFMALAHTDERSDHDFLSSMAKTLEALRCLRRLCKEVDDREIEMQKGAA